MRQYDVFANLSDGRGFAPALVVLSSHLVTAQRALVAPLLADLKSGDAAVDIAITFEGLTYVLGVSEMLTVDQRLLRRRLGSLAHDEDVIRRALDRLFTGF